MNDLVEFLDRQFRYLDELSDDDYIHQVVRWLRTLGEEPRLNALIADIRSDAVAAARRFFAHDDSMVLSIRTLRDELDSSGVMPADQNDKSSLEEFDKIAGRSPTAEDRGIPTFGTRDSSRSRVLLDSLRVIINRRLSSHGAGTAPVAARAELNRIGLALTNLERAHQYEFRRFLSDKLTSGPISLIHLITFLSELNPEPVPLSTSPEALGAAVARVQSEMASGISELRERLYINVKAPSEIVRGDIVSDWERSLRPHVRRVQEEVRRRVGTRLSLVGLLRRFKQRCEWHDRGRLRDVVERARVAGRKPEDALTAELGIWLFDQGYSPFSEPSIGGLKPDLLDPGQLYVEAKRYGSGESPRATIVKGARQVYSTVQRLRGTDCEIQEALFVVFREGGPLCLLPEVVHCGGWDLLPVLIDIAPPEESGRREKHQPHFISESELGLREDHVTASDTD